MSSRLRARQNDTMSTRSWKPEEMSETWWRILILTTSALALLLSWFCLVSGITTVFTHLYYIPIILLAYRYHRNGIFASMILGILYLLLTLLYFNGNLIELAGSLERFFIYILVAVVVAYLSAYLERERQEYRNLSRFSESIISNAQVLLAVMDRKGTIVVWNRAAEDISGYTSAEVLGNNTVWKLLYPDREYRKEITATITTITREKKFFENFVTEIRAKDGSPKTISWNTRALDSGDNSPGTFVSIGIDITGRKKTEDEVHAAYAQLSAADEKLRLQYDELEKSQHALAESEAGYRNILRTAMDGFCIVDMNGSFIDVNDAFCTMLGYTRDEMLSLSLGSIEDRESPDDISRHKDEIVRKGEDRFETRYRCRDGRIIDVEVSVVAARTHGGHFVTFHRDITERRRAEKALRESEARFRAIFNASFQFTGLMKPDGTMMAANQSALDFSGITSAEIVGIPLWETPWFRGNEKRVRDLRDAVARAARGEFVRYEVELQGAADTRGTFDFSLKPVPDRDGTIILLIPEGRDITERKQAEVALSRATKKLSTLNTITFADLQSAVFSLYGFMELLKSGPPGERQQHFLERQVEIVRTISDLLEFSKRYQGLGQKTPSWQNVLDTFLIGISHTDLSQFSRVLEIEGLEIYADPLLENVFFTLAENVIRHGKTATEIRLFYKKCDNGMTIFFENNGEGIPGDMKERIFERRYEEKKGLGLFLAREILGVTGMTIQETGNPGTGARFEIFVPEGAYRFSGNR